MSKLNLKLELVMLDVVLVGQRFNNGAIIDLDLLQCIASSYAVAILMLILYWYQCQYYYSIGISEIFIVRQRFDHHFAV